MTNVKWCEKEVPNHRTVHCTTTLRTQGMGHAAQQNILVHLYIKIHKTWKEKAACSLITHTSYFRADNNVSPVCLSDGSPGEGGGISIYDKIY